MSDLISTVKGFYDAFNLGDSLTADVDSSWVLRRGSGRHRAVVGERSIGLRGA